VSIDDLNISVRGKYEMWNLMDETIYEKLDADI
jgi:hypothetical protein